MSEWKTNTDLESFLALIHAISRLEKELPGWWWSCGQCHVTSDASIGPDRNGKDAELLKYEEFDAGFHADIPLPSTVAEALNEAIDKAVEARDYFFETSGRMATSLT